MDDQTLIKNIDIHLLDLHYRHTRIRSDKALVKIQHSIKAYGQLVPAVVVAAKDRFVLIDGHLRLSALQACGNDVIKARVVGEDEPEALVTLLITNTTQQLEVIEQASLIQELHNRFTLSFAEIAKRLGRDKSWVKRRLDLLDALPEEAHQGVMSGKLSAWAASRILAPLARANEQDCVNFTRAIIENPLSTRELASLYDHYQKSTRSVRDRIIAKPALFIKTLKEQEQKTAGRKVGEGPEGQWLRDISIVCHILDRLKKISESMFYSTLDRHQKVQCKTWLNSAERRINELKQQAERKQYDHPGIPADNP